MDWLDQRHDFSEADLEEFRFHPSTDFSATGIRIKRPALGGSESSCKPDEIKSEKDYVTWLKQVEAPSPESYAGIVLVVYPRMTDSDTGSLQSPGATSLQQTKETFRIAAKHLFQHRSICDVLCRTSTTVFSSRQARWESEGTYGPSIVYNCQSDRQSRDIEDDIAMSVTWFPQSRKTFGVIYGGSRRTSLRVKLFSKKIQDSKTALHPLLLPMMFAELERKRLLNSFDRKKSDIYQRIVDMERSMGNASHSEDSLDRREATELWMDGSSQRTGLESMKVQLGRMMEHSKWLSGKYFKARPGHADEYAEEREVGEMIEAKLQEMMAECDSKAQSFGDLLTGMNLATQMEWNYYSRNDAKATHFITSQAKKDSGQMKFIARLGMFFLPPTFLASFFSMGFFKWIPEDSKQVVSPFIVIWAGLVLAIALAWWAYWRLGMRKKKRDKSQEYGLHSLDEVKNTPEVV